MIKKEISGNPQIITDIEPWEKINSFANSNRDNTNIAISEIEQYFNELRSQESNNTISLVPKVTAEVERLKAQVQELNKNNEKLKAEIGSYDAKIKQYGNNTELENSLKFKIRILIRNNSANLIKQFKQECTEKQKALLPKEERLNSKPFENLFKNINNVSTQTVNSPYNNLKDRIEAIASQVNSPSEHNQAID